MLYCTVLADQGKVHRPSQVRCEPSPYMRNLKNRQERREPRKKLRLRRKKWKRRRKKLRLQDKEQTVCD